jgi:hypothetical protein
MKPDPNTTANSDASSNESNSSALPSQSSNAQAQSQNVITQSPQPVSPSKSASQKIDNLPNPAKRLEELNDLFKRGLITQKEYDAKKAEILKSI